MNRKNGSVDMRVRRYEVRPHMASTAEVETVQKKPPPGSGSHNYNIICNVGTAWLENG